MENKYYIGLDLGQAQDYTALAVVEKIVKKDTKDPNYHVRALERFALGTPYPVQVSRINEVMTHLPGSILVIDQTGVGRAVFDMFRTSGVHPVGITITGGDRATSDASGWKVPKRDLVGALTIAFQTEALKIAGSLPEAGTLIAELQNFRVKINLKTAHDSYEAWREGIHDDLVLSLAMAVWYAGRPKPGRFRVVSLTW